MGTSTTVGSVFVMAVADKVLNRSASRMKFKSAAGVPLSVLLFVNASSFLILFGEARLDQFGDDVGLLDLPADQHREELKKTMRASTARALFIALSFTSPKELLHRGHCACVLSTERMRHSRQNACPQGVVTGDHNKLCETNARSCESQFTAVGLPRAYRTFEISCVKLLFEQR